MTKKWRYIFKRYPGNANGAPRPVTQTSTAGRCNPQSSTSTAKHSTPAHTVFSWITAPCPLFAAVRRLKHRGCFAFLLCEPLSWRDTQANTIAVDKKRRNVHKRGVHDYNVMQGTELPFTLRTTALGIHVSTVLSARLQKFDEQMLHISYTMHHARARLLATRKLYPYLFLPIHNEYCECPAH